MSKSIFLTFAIAMTVFTAEAQFKFVEKGRVVFERKINTYAILPEFANKPDIGKLAFASNVQGDRSEQQQFWTDNFQLTFDKNKTFYEPVGRVSSFMNGVVGIPVSHANKVYIDSSTFIAEKLAYNETMIVKGSLTKIKWKLTSETREICGYECRRANALINDSLYVVAFYTDAIKSNGGPELFSGLPGIILGVVLPHQHISYFATKVDVSGAYYFPPLKDGIIKSAITQKEFDMAVTGYLKESNKLNSWTRIFIGL